MKKKILYLMHVHWNWIKQRPHFIAEGLGDYFDVTVAYQKLYKTNELTNNEKLNEKLNFFEFIPIPFKERNKILSWINKYFIKLQFILFKPSKNYEIVWMTHPGMYQHISHNAASQIIYDCMDDVLEFPMIKNNLKMKQELFDLEKKLCEVSGLIFCSSFYLKTRLITRYNLDEKKINIINNGIDLKNLENRELPMEFNKYFLTKTKKIVYIGTISEWFDFDLILKSLNILNNVDYLLFGPTGVQIPKHKNIIYCGPVQHKYVSSVMEKADILVMPFKVNELIKSVNPVKAYEYIYSGKPSLIVEYEETKKFKDYLFLYNSENDFIEKIKNLISLKLTIEVSKKNRIGFIKNSQWSHKAFEIVSTLRNNI